MDGQNVAFQRQAKEKLGGLKAKIGLHVSIPGDFCLWGMSWF